MSDYLIGDVQGCFDSLQALLKKIKFSTDKDRLFFLGDVVNRGDKSLATLRLIKDLGENAKMVLGNHDFHLLACSLGGLKPTIKDTFSDIMGADDHHLLIDFLLQQPLVIKHEGALLVHAGIPPSWDEDTVFKQSSIVEQHLQNDNVGAFINNMYDDHPYTWSNDLNEMDACRYTINACMRMRVCKADDTLEFTHKMNHDTAPVGFKAWFSHDNRALKNTDIFFGHWSTLNKVNPAHVYPMDHGCAWGGQLSVIRLKDKKVVSVDC